MTGRGRWRCKAFLPSHSPTPFISERRMALTFSTHNDFLAYNTSILLSQTNIFVVVIRRPTDGDRAVKSDGNEAATY